jgi:S-DNA-T family DNA segregation ATPase FtsK/SpoIIIE
LLGNGDMLFLWPGTSTLLRGQGTYLSDEEINLIVDHCSRGEQNFVQELVNIKVKDKDGEEEETAKPGALKKRDELYESAVDLVVREGRGSVSLLQRALGIGYGRAARLIDFMAEDGIVGQYNGSQARDIMITLADWERMQGLSSGEDSGDSANASTTATASPPRRNIVKPAAWEDEAEEDEARSDDVDETQADEGDDELAADETDEQDDGFRAESA